MRKLLTLLLIISLFFIHVSSAYAAKSSLTSQKTKQKIVTSSVPTVKKAKPPTKYVPVKTSVNKSSIQKRANKDKLTAARSESQIDTVLRRAASVMGTPYAYGSSGGGSFDCSGFTIYAFKAIKVNLPRTSAEQAKLGVSVNKASLQKGDLVIFNNPANTRIGHVGIYMGDNNFIHASTSKGVTITSLSDSYYKIRYVGARRILN